MSLYLFILRRILLPLDILNFKVIRYLLLFFIGLLYLGASAQAETEIFTDSISAKYNDIYNIGIINDSCDIKSKKVKITYDDSHKFRWRQLAPPLGLIAVGAITLKHTGLRIFNKDIQGSIKGKQKLPFDYYIQYLPMITPYALRICGVKGIHNYLEMSIILATSYLIMSSTITILKNSVTELRPDGSSLNSFPSGHTATAFMGAEFLRKEYCHVSPFISWGGYIVAAATGVMRMHNNRHYPTDVLTGAGIGVLSTKIAYWIYPYMQRLFFGKHHKCSTAISAVPFYNPNTQSYGIGCVFNL